MTIPALIQQLRKQGWCVIRDGIPSDLIPALWYDVYRIADCYGVIAPAYVHNQDWRGRALELASASSLAPAWTKHITEIPFYFRPGVINECPRFANVPANPRVLSVVRKFLGASPALASLSLVAHETDTPEGPWRRGGVFTAIQNGDLSSPEKAGRFPSHLVACWLISDFTRESGGLRILPDSHRPGARASEGVALEGTKGPARGECTVTAPAGSVILLDGRLWSAIAANPSDFPRLSLMVDYVPDQDGKRVATEFRRMTREVTPTMPAAIFAKLPTEVQPLFRYWPKPAR